ncbi:unnamed protein product [Angiostrongylus costaricensis]|uniref:G-patch domain-containing protein n=1 Tax=Angiostrongylus costaricensis TaxID=334426 RepID=A0A158PLN3_ANGCS|nr:unnamed protein product [Angiostrongylus costaricensis]
MQDAEVEKLVAAANGDCESCTVHGTIYLFSNSCLDLVNVVCDRNPSLPYCNRSVLRRKEADSPDDPFKEQFVPINTEEEESELEESTEFEEETTKRTSVIQFISLYHADSIAAPESALHRISNATERKGLEKRFTLRSRYCPVNQYTFQTTCLPGKKLRYDLQVFCQEFSEMCGVPNINLYPSRHADPTDEGRPKGYGQKQKNGQLGLGKSFGFGLGAIPGFEVVTSQGADIGKGNIPFLNQIGGIILNQGMELGALGHRTGKGPARSMNALTHGYPSFGIGGEPNNGDKKLSQEVLKSFGIPNLPGLNKVFGKLGGNRSNKRVRGYEPGYGALNPNAPVAIGKVDHDAINLPGGFGEVEIEKGGGFGIGKK